VGGTAAAKRRAGLGPVAAMGARASTSVPATPASEWAPYVAASCIADSIDDEAAIHFVADVLQCTPLPSPWVIGTGDKGQRLFINARTGMSTWEHPLLDVLKLVADLYQYCAPLSQEHRDEVLSGFHQICDVEAKNEYCKWRTLQAEGGDEYYVNVVTHEATWENPAKAFLPGYYMRSVAIARLRNPGYLQGLRSRACPSCTLERHVDDSESEPTEWRLDMDLSSTMRTICEV